MNRFGVVAALLVPIILILIPRFGPAVELF
jgi:hypothetical protein